MGVFDIILLVNLTAQLLPTSHILTTPCRPLMTRIPQCQDLIFPLSTYFMVFSINLILVIVLDASSRQLKMGSGLEIIVFNPSRVLENRRSSLLRLLVAISCFNDAFGPPLTRFPRSGQALFPVTDLLDSSIRMTLAAFVTAAVISISWDIRAPWSHSDMVQSETGQDSVHESDSFRTAVNDSIADPFKIIPSPLLVEKRHLKKWRRTPKRRPLTPETFLPLDIPKTQSLDTVQLGTPLTDPALVVTQSETSFDPVSVEPVTLPEASFEYEETDEPVRAGSLQEPFERPGSRLGFASKAAHSRIFDNEEELEGMASAFGKGRTKHSSSLQVVSKLDYPPFTPTSETASSDGSMSPPSPGFLPYVQRLEENDSDEETVFDSPSKSPYNWRNVLSLLVKDTFTEFVAEELEEEEDARYLVARRPLLETIEELSEEDE